MFLTPTPPGPTAGDAVTRCACELGPLATRRKRVAFACRCAAWAVGPWADARVRRLFDTGRAYAARAETLDTVQAALQEVEEVVAESQRPQKDALTIFEVPRAGGALVAGRSARTAMSAVHWALGTGGAAPTVPPGWGWARAALAASGSAPACAPAWLTPDVVALARLARNGNLGVLPILADALQDAGCENEATLGHCRSPEEGHTRGCWVPDLLLDTD